MKHEDLEGFNELYNSKLIQDRECLNCGAILNHRTLAHKDDAPQLSDDFCLSMCSWCGNLTAIDNQTGRLKELTADDWERIKSLPDIFRELEAVRQTIRWQRLADMIAWLQRSN